MVTTNTYREGDSQQSNITESIRNTMDTLLLHIKMQEEFNHRSSQLKQIEATTKLF